MTKFSYVDKYMIFFGLVAVGVWGFWYLTQGRKAKASSPSGS